jgi:hypothetical protein
VAQGFDSAIQLDQRVQALYVRSGTLNIAGESLEASVRITFRNPDKWLYLNCRKRPDNQICRLSHGARVSKKGVHCLERIPPQAKKLPN